MNTMFYFAYGSNMSKRRLLQRIPLAEYLGSATLIGYQFVFHKVSRVDDSAKCGITMVENDNVFGVLYRLPIDELLSLDRYEGQGYQRTLVEVEDEQGQFVQASTYVATQLDRQLQPFTWYQQHVLIGAREARLPSEYIERIEAVTTIKDPDLQREVSELSIYQADFTADESQPFVKEK